MSPRRSRHSITIEARPELKSNYIYEVVVVGLSVDKKKRVVTLIGENQNRAQYGRRHTVILPLPAWPGSPVSRFLECLGVDTTPIGQEVHLDTLVGRSVGITFLDPKAEPADHRSVTFSRLKERASRGNHPA